MITQDFFRVSSRIILLLVLLISCEHKNPPDSKEPEKRIQEEKKQESKENPQEEEKSSKKAIHLDGSADFAFVVAGEGGLEKKNFSHELVVDLCVEKEPLCSFFQLGGSWVEVCNKGVIYKGNYKNIPLIIWTDCPKL